MMIPTPNYTQVPNAILDNLHQFTPAQTVTLMAICRATFGWHKRKASISLNRLTRITGLSKQGILNATAELAGKGILKITGKQTRTYQLVVNSVDQQVVNSVDPIKEKDLKEKTCLRETPKKEKKFDPLDVELPAGMNPKDWQDFVEHRQSIKRRLTQQAVTRILNKVQREKWKPSEIREAIANSVEAGWSGLFRPKPKGTTQRNGNYSAGRAAHDVRGGDAQNRSHPDYKPVRGQNITDTRTSWNYTEQQKEVQAQTSKRILDAQAAALLKQVT